MRGKQVLCRPEVTPLKGGPAAASRSYISQFCQAPRCERNASKAHMQKKKKNSIWHLPPSLPISRGAKLLLQPRAELVKQPSEHRAWSARAAD